MLDASLPLDPRSAARRLRRKYLEEEKTKNILYFTLPKTTSNPAKHSLGSSFFLKVKFTAVYYRNFSVLFFLPAVHSRNFSVLLFLPAVHSQNFSVLLFLPAVHFRNFSVLLLSAFPQFLCPRTKPIPGISLSSY